MVPAPVPEFCACGWCPEFGVGVGAGVGAGDSRRKAGQKSKAKCASSRPTPTTHILFIFPGPVLGAGLFSVAIVPGSASPFAHLVPAVGSVSWSRSRRRESALASVPSPISASRGFCFRAGDEPKIFLSFLIGVIAPTAQKKSNHEKDTSRRSACQTRLFQPMTWQRQMPQGESRCSSPSPV